MGGLEFWASSTGEANKKDSKDPVSLVPIHESENEF